MTARPDDITHEHVAELRVALGARAAGYWWIAGDLLEQIGFAASPVLPEDVSHAFAEATRAVALDRDDLGIVRAATTGDVVVSRAAELPAEAGSGYWLRAFGASRSVAVPVRDAKGTVRAVVSAAVGDGPTDDEVAHRIESIAQSWIPTT